ncbi:MAG TPA: LysM peptidoglycan-binding domain-containing protein [Desulfosalsimonadaceae bacterium]|nr:LysM peptidoglycan-binding domain-containing protein [Desulfosalsimonadaceae bacterium]
MVWQDDQENGAYSDKPYSTLSDRGAGGFLSRAETPFILLGAGLLILLLLFFVFFQGGEGDSSERLQEFSQRLDTIEKRVQKTSGLRQRVSDMEARLGELERRISSEKERLTPDPRLIDRVESNQESVKANADSIDKTMQRFNLLEKRLNRMENNVQQMGETLAEKAAAKPKSSADSGKVKIHVVEKGDTLFSIAQDNGVDLQRFLRINGLNENSVIKPGQKLKIPVE